MSRRIEFESQSLLKRNAIKGKPFEELESLQQEESDCELTEESDSDHEKSRKNGAKGKSTNKSLSEKKSDNSVVQHASSSSAINQSYIPYFCYSALGILISVAIYYLIAYYYTTVTLENKISTIEINDFFSNLKKQFPEQSEVTWRRLKAAINNNFNNPLYPATILLLAAKNAEHNTIGVGKLLAKISSGDAITLNGTELAKYSHDARLEIQNAFYRTKEHQVLLFFDIDKVPVTVITILHGYCDHENSPFKKLIFIMTATSDEPFSDDGKRFDQVANQHLTHAWQELGKDKLPALLARITGTVGFIKDFTSSSE